MKKKSTEKESQNKEAIPLHELLEKIKNDMGKESSSICLWDYM
jgi:hypothetical protein